MCEERVRRKVLASSCASREDDTQTKVGREVKEKMKTVKRGDGCDVRSIEEIKAEIALVERQLREKRGGRRRRRRRRRRRGREGEEVADREDAKERREGETCARLESSMRHNQSWCERCE
jgi:hypothetical protein